MKYRIKTTLDKNGYNKYTLQKKGFDLKFFEYTSIMKNNISVPAFWFGTIFIAFPFCLIQSLFWIDVYETNDEYDAELEFLSEIREIKERKIKPIYVKFKIWK